MTIKEIIKKENLLDKNVLVDVRIIASQEKDKSYHAGYYGINKNNYEPSQYDNENWDDIINEDIKKYNKYPLMKGNKYDLVLGCEYDLEKELK